MTTEVKIYEAGPPLVGKWAVMWRTPFMPVSAFRYFDTREEAEEAVRRILRK